jgi:proline iminopeptidase
MPPPFRTDAVRIRGTPHTLHVAHYGTPTGTPAIFLHGGPGSCIDDGCADAFDHKNWHVVAFDQRGCGRSTPRDALDGNTPQAAVEDVERLRKRYFKQQQVVLVGGSYGSLLALLYATKYAKHLRAFVVRGVYFGGPILHPAAQRANTRAWRTLKRRTKRKTLRGITHYTAKRLAAQHDPALARAWCRVEEVGLVSDPRDLKGTPWADPNDADRHTCALLEAHFKTHRFWLDGGPEALLKGATQALLHARVPGVILHGEDDTICPVANARRLHSALDDGSGRVALDVVKGAAHSALDRKNARALRAAVRRVHAQLVSL